ncbi:hypothetical protein J0H58_36750 [bacterium]|nr:hypothetical protein [bacterium]
MPAVPESERVAILREWGVSEPLIRLSCGEVLHEQFNDCCLGPPWYVYHGSLQTPEVAPLAVLWEWCDKVTGVWHRSGRLEFIEYGFGGAEEFEVVARTEQGFWADQFDFLYECDGPLEELRAAAAAVGFRFLERHLSAREAAGAVLGTYEGHQAWLRALIATIDAETQDAEPVAAPDPAT